MDFVCTVFSGRCPELYLFRPGGLVHFRRDLDGVAYVLERNCTKVAYVLERFWCNVAYVLEKVLVRLAVLITLYHENGRKLIVRQ